MFCIFLSPGYSVQRGQFERLVVLVLFSIFAMLGGIAYHPKRSNVAIRFKKVNKLRKYLVVCHNFQIPSCLMSRNVIIQLQKPSAKFGAICSTERQNGKET